MIKGEGTRRFKLPVHTLKYNVYGCIILSYQPLMSSNACHAYDALGII